MRIDVTFEFLETTGMLDAMHFLRLIPLRIDHGEKINMVTFVCMGEELKQIKEGEVIPKALIIVHKDNDSITYEVNYL